METKKVKKMPQSCWTCPYLGGKGLNGNVRFIGDDENCFVKQGSLELHCLSKKERHPDCPLKLKKIELAIPPTPANKEIR